MRLVTAEPRPALPSWAGLECGRGPAERSRGRLCPAEPFCSPPCRAGRVPSCSAYLPWKESILDGFCLKKQYDL